MPIPNYIFETLFPSYPFRSLGCRLVAPASSRISAIFTDEGASGYLHCLLFRELCRFFLPGISAVGGRWREGYCAELDFEKRISQRRCSFSFRLFYVSAIKAFEQLCITGSEEWLKVQRHKQFQPIHMLMVNEAISFNTLSGPELSLVLQCYPSSLNDGSWHTKCSANLEL